jgi:monoamine oxidase
LLLSSSSYGGFFIGQSRHVVIIGGGLAGLSAAAYLTARKVKVTLLEAGSDVGGRVLSNRFKQNNKLVVELGAEWVGNSHNRVIEMCDEMKLPLFDNTFKTDLIYEGRHQKAGGWDYTETWRQQLEQLLQQFRDMPKEKQDELDQLDWWRYLVNNGCSGRDLDLRELVDSTDFGESIRHVSALAAISEYAENGLDAQGRGSINNQMDKKIVGGNNLLAQRLADKVGRANILLNSPVTRVQQTTEGVKVTYGQGKVLEADKLICALPTFALKKIDWQPGLPDALAAAINALQYARINKSVFLFNNRFWGREDFDMVTDTPMHYLYHATKTQAGPMGALTAYSIGDKAPLMHQQGEAYRAAMLELSLKPMTPKVSDKIAGQVNYYWGSNAYTQGAYALYGINQWVPLRKELNNSFMHTHFAGEHLAEWQGFMEGAINTGEATAEAVMS